MSKLISILITKSSSPVNNQNLQLA